MLENVNGKFGNYAIKFLVSLVLGKYDEKYAEAEKGLFIHISFVIHKG